MISLVEGGGGVERPARCAWVKAWPGAVPRVAARGSAARDTIDLNKAWARVKLGATWKRYVVKPSDFDAPDSLNKGWDVVRNTVTTFTIFGVEGSRFWVDDIRLHGVNPWELQ